MRNLLFTLLFFTLLIVPQAACADDYDIILKQADHRRSSHPNELKNILSLISPVNLNKDQYQLFRYLLGYSKNHSGKMDEGLQIFLDLYDNSSGDIKIRTLASLSNMYSSTANWTQGLHTTNLLVASLNKIKNPDLVDEIIVTIAVFYNQIGDFELAEQYSGMLLTRTQNSRSVCLAKSQKAEAWFKSQKRIELETLLIETIRDCSAVSEHLTKNVANGFLAEHMTSTGRINDAKVLLESNLTEVEQIGHSTLITKFYSLLAKLNLQLNHYDEANQWASRAVSLQTTTQYQPALVSAFETLYLVAEHNQDFQQALIFHKSYLQVTDRYLDDIKNREMVIQQNKLENAENRTRMTLLDKENTILKTKAELSDEQAQNNRLALALACSLVVVLILWSYRNRRLQIKLRRLAETDELTGVSNRHHFNQLAQNLIDESRLAEQPISFILFDLDHFKNVNDNFGHQAGDLALINAVKTAKSVCRVNDAIARMGGEEFAILLPGCDVEKALHIAELCRAAIQDLEISINNNTIRITASFGVADAKVCDYSYEKIFAGADSALYRSKTSGRNQVYEYNQEQLSLNV